MDAEEHRQLMKEWNDAKKHRQWIKEQMEQMLDGVERDRYYLKITFYVMLNLVLSTLSLAIALVIYHLK